ncbi:MAG: hypothetical protein HFJ33_06900 [Clostridia bacterium]|nr:hypothetical protein [Clostridia bacterium]
MKKIVIGILLVGLLVLNFSSNFLGDKKEDIEGKTFETFQNDSEYLVFSNILQDKYEQNANIWGLCEGMDQSNKRVENIWELIKKEESQSNEITTVDYVSQFGLQGHVFSFLYNKLKLPFWCLKLLCCTLLALIIVLICYFIASKYNKLMGVIFYITFLLSPWVVAFARNLYWVEFTWFLPPLFGIMLSKYRNQKKIFIPCILVAIFIKCLCGYEYISTIMLATISFFVIDFFIEKGKEEKKEIVKTTILVGITCVIAFAMAILVHATARGEGNILQGVKDIYQKDILRRTILTSDIEQFPEIYHESLQATVIETVGKYFTWHTQMILGIEGKYFKLMFLTTIAIMIYNTVKKEKDYVRDIVMFLVFLSTTLSWLILGKSHSYIHTTMNYVLWYFGFIQICIYIIVKFFFKITYQIGKIEEGKNKEEKNGQNSCTNTML